jgi:hypothetical protein
MMDRSPKPPEALIQAIAADLKPVRPSPRPMQLALRTIPFALLASSLILMALGLRRDSAILGPLLTWGASSGQFLLAIALIWIAAHESLPAGRLPRRIVAATMIAACLVVVIDTLLTFSASPAGGRPGAGGWRAGVACGLGSPIVGGLLVLLLGWLFRNSVAARPALAGALYGAGVGVAINSGWRIACPASGLGHTLGAHGAAMVATVLIGSLIGRAFGGRRLMGGGSKAIGHR